MVRPHARARAGFSLIELLIALVIMGVMAAAIAPSLSEVLADNRQGAAAQDLVRLSRRARALAMGSGTAHLLRFQSASSGSLGAISLFAGMNSKCLQTPWAQAFPPPANPNLRPIEVFDMTEYNGWDGVGSPPTDGDVGRQVVTLRATLGAGNNPAPLIWLCYQPNGDAYTMTVNPADPAQFLRQTQSILFTLARFVRTSGGVVPHGRDRQVMFPVGGTARAR